MARIAVAMQQPNVGKMKETVIMIGIALVISNVEKAMVEMTIAQIHQILRHQMTVVMILTHVIYITRRFYGGGFLWQKNA